jgi:two-component system, LuxR family, response regulator FixJ
VSDDVLLTRLKEAIAKDAKNRRARQANPQFFARLALLTPREREVMELVAQGLTMKQIAMEFGISIQTASKHRIRLLEKLGVANDIELVKTLMNTAPTPSPN